MIISQCRLCNSNWWQRKNHHHYQRLTVVTVRCSLVFVCWPGHANNEAKDNTSCYETYWPKCCCCYLGLTNHQTNSTSSATSKLLCSTLTEVSIKCIGTKPQTCGNCVLARLGNAICHMHNVEYSSSIDSI